MKLVRVLIPFRLKDTDTDHVAGDEIKVTDEQLAKIKSINVNMVEVLGEAEVELEKPKKTRKKN